MIYVFNVTNLLKTSDFRYFSNKKNFIQTFDRRNFKKMAKTSVFFNFPTFDRKIN